MQAPGQHTPGTGFAAARPASHAPQGSCDVTTRSTHRTRFIQEAVEIASAAAYAVARIRADDDAIELMKAYESSSSMRSRRRRPHRGLPGDAGQPQHGVIENAIAEPLNRAMMEWFFGHVTHTPQDTKDPRIDLVHADLRPLPSVIDARLDPLRKFTGRAHRVRGRRARALRSRARTAQSQDAQAYAGRRLMAALIKHNAAQRRACANFCIRFPNHAHAIPISCCIGPRLHHAHRHRARKG